MTDFSFVLTGFFHLFYRKKKTYQSSFQLFLLKNKQGLLTFSCDQMNRGSFKDKGLADLIFQETQVREVHEFFFVDKDDKGRRSGRYLSRIKNLEAFALV